MRRRSLLRGATSMVAAASVPTRFAIGQGRGKVLRFVPTADLSILDPSFTTTQVSITHGYYVFDTLYGIDHNQQPQPQMAAGHTISDDGRTWLIRLRNGLRFHDGTPVLARDCAASLARWSSRDVYGQTLAAFVDQFGTADDQTIRITLKSPFPLLLYAIGKPNGMLPVMMPERLARTDPAQQVKEMTGSGPYRFLKDEFVSGSSGAYAKFENYVPRQEPPDWASGGKVAHMDRIEWRIIPDPSTASAALQKGEIDWWEQVQPDLLPLLRRSRDVKVDNFNPVGFFGTMRFNHLNPPFNNVRMRRAIQMAVDQEDYMRAVTGNDPELFRSCRALFPCGTPYGEELGTGLMTGDLAAARTAIKAAGYGGEKIVILNPADVASIAPFGHVTFDLFKKLGLNVEMEEMDWNTLVTRRSRTDPIEKGGWSVFHNWWIGTSIADPAISTVVRGLGAKGWAGSYSNETIEALSRQWLSAPTEPDRRRLVTAIHQEALADVPTILLGRFFIQTAYRKNLTGLLQGTSPYPWNLAWT